MVAGNIILLRKTTWPSLAIGSNEMMLRHFDGDDVKNNSPCSKMSSSEEQ